MPNNKEILVKLIKIINSIRPIKNIAKDKISEFNLIDSGHLDSMEIIKLNISIEQRFKIKINFKDKNLKKFKTVKGICSVISKSLPNKTQ